MKLNEIEQPSDKKLEEAFADNDTGFLTEDLIKIARVQESNWSQPMTSEQLNEHVRKVCGG